MVFSDGIERALRVALEAHAGQTRKGAEGLPYISHPMHVALILARIGMDGVTLQAALLHDVVEDCEGWDEARVRSSFGDEVADIVAALTEDKARSWDERKRQAIDDVPRVSDASAHVKAADKLHNLSCLLDDLERAAEPDAVWAQFRGGREKTLTTARDLVDALESRVHPELARALQGVLAALEARGHAD